MDKRPLKKYWVRGALSMAGLCVLWFAVSLVLSVQRHAAERAAGLFATVECRQGRLFSDSEALLAGAFPDAASAAREDWEAFGIRAKVVHRLGVRHLLVKGHWVWPFTFEEPIPLEDCGTNAITAP